MLKLLIVEDELDLANNLKWFLESEPDRFEVLLAESAEDAFDLLGEVRFDLILSDVRLPGMDGIDFIRRVCSGLPQTKAIIMTAFASDDIRQRALRSGAIRFIEKPLDLEDLRLLCWEVIEGESQDRGGLSVADFLGLLEVGGKSEALHVHYGRDRGTLVIDQGQVIHAATSTLKGHEAVQRMLSWPLERVEEISPAALKSFKRNLTPGAKPKKAGAQPAAKKASATSADASTNTFDLKSLREAVSAPPEETAPSQPESGPEVQNMATVEESLAKAMQITGAIGVALVDYETGMTLGSAGGGPDFDIELGAAGNTEVVRAKKAIRDKLGLKDLIEDILITLEGQYHLIRMLHSSTKHFFYFVADRKKANLAMARMELAKIDQALDL